MLKLTFIDTDNKEHTVEAFENWSLMQIAKHHQIKGIIGRCGGSMVCTTCHGYIERARWEALQSSDDNQQSEEEIDILEGAQDHAKNSRLLCQIIMTKDLDGLRIKVAHNK